MSVSESDDVVRLAAIPTIRKLYKDAVLAVPEKDEIRYKSNPSFLDRISLYQGDITELEVDSIVNAANKSLLGGGGVDGAIHRAAGPHLVEECKSRTEWMCHGRHIIHTVGPVYSPREVEEKAVQLASCYRTSLEVGTENEVRHIAFPSISTGVYGYPIEDATHIALDEVRRFIESEKANKLERVIFVVWSNKDRDVYRSLLPQYFPPEEETSSEKKSHEILQETPGETVTAVKAPQKTLEEIASAT